MSDGLYCTYCGHYEATHADPSLLEDDEFTGKRSGYRFPISDCPGFTLTRDDDAWLRRKNKQRLDQKLAVFDRHVARGSLADMLGH
jgi:hypothetical protein